MPLTNTFCMLHKCIYSHIHKVFVIWSRIQAYKGNVKFSRSPSDCQDPVQSKIDLLPLLQLCSDHPPRLQHYTNQTPKLRTPLSPPMHYFHSPWTPNDLGEPRSHSCLHLSSSLVLLNSELTFMSSSQFHLSVFNILNHFHTLALSF